MHLIAQMKQQQHETYCSLTFALIPLSARIIWEINTGIYDIRLLPALHELLFFFFLTRLIVSNTAAKSPLPRQSNSPT